MDFFLNSIDQVASVEWGKNHYWDVRFGVASPYNSLSPPPPPFATWFPATSIEENLATVSSQTIESFLSTHPFPLRSTNFNVQLTYLDDANHTLAQWLSEWINVDIFNSGNFVSPVSDIVRVLYVVKYKIINGQKVPLGDPSKINFTNVLDASMYGFNAYYVYPDTTFNFTGSSDSGSPEYTVDFRVAGMTSYTNALSNEKQAIKELPSKFF